MTTDKKRYFVKFVLTYNGEETIETCTVKTEEESDVLPILKELFKENCQILIISLTEDK